MGEKDIVEKILEDYPDVFADIVNVLLFDGRREVRPEELGEAGTRSQFKSERGTYHEEERDVAKYWVRDGRRLALFGLENQTSSDGDMPLRVVAYDDAGYKTQMMKCPKDNGQDTDMRGHGSRGKKERYAILTLVLHFGEYRWESASYALRDRLAIPESLREFVEDYHIRVYNIAHLTEEQLRLFRSDFGLLAEFMVRKRRNEPFAIPQDRKIDHVDAFLKMLSVFAGDEDVESLKKIMKTREEEGECIMGCNISEAWKDLGRTEGRAEGRSEGRREGQADVNLLITYMIRDGRIEELERSASDSMFQEQLFEEYGLKR